MKGVKRLMLMHVYIHKIFGPNSMPCLLKFAKEELSHFFQLYLVYRIFEAVAEDLAIEDTLFCLDKALQEERMDSASYLKVNIILEAECI